MVDADTPENARLVVSGSFDFTRVPYVPIRRRDGQSLCHVLHAGARLHHAGAQDRERIAQWLRQPHVYPPLGFTRAPEENWVRRSQVPDGTGTMEPVELLMLREASTDAAVGFYLCYESRRGRCQEVDFALGATEVAGSVALLRAGKIATLAWLMAVCGVQEVHWLRRKLDPATGHYPRQSRVYAVSRAQFAATLRRLERTGTADHLPVIVTAPREATVADQPADRPDGRLES